MAPHSTKRRRVEDDVRPRKKVRKVKKQTEYHSSSEDEGSESIPSSKATGSNLVQRLSPKPKIAAKAILKHKFVPSKPVAAPPARTEDVEDEDEDEDEDGQEVDALELNTALNMDLTADNDDDEEDDEPDINDVDADTDEPEDDDIDEDDLDDDSVSDTSTTNTATHNKKKRNDPTAFATSISKILTTKLTSSKRSDPILSRSKTADEASKALADSKLDTKARASIRAEKRSLLEKGRVRDVLGLDTPGVDTGAIMEEEKRLKKTAQRGVVKLFNAVRAAQVRGEEAERQAKAQGMVGMQKRDEKVNEMSKEGFLELLSRGGKSAVAEA